MNVQLLHSTPLWVAANAIRSCWASEGKSDTEELEQKMYKSLIQTGVEKGYAKDRIKCSDIIGEADKALIERVGNKFKHASTLEHLNYTFRIEGISRACLQEIARHRHASLSVKSTRYTLKELKEEEPWNPAVFDQVIGVFDQPSVDRAKKYIVLTGDSFVDAGSIWALEGLRRNIAHGISNDIAKFCLPESYKTSLVWTINARSLQNFLSLRSDKSALWEIRNLAHAIYEQLPEEHKYLFVDFMKTEGSLCDNTPPKGEN